MIVLPGTYNGGPSACCCNFVCPSPCNLFSQIRFQFTAIPPAYTGIVPVGWTSWLDLDDTPCQQGGNWYGTYPIAGNFGCYATDGFSVQTPSGTIYTPGWWFNFGFNFAGTPDGSSYWNILYSTYPPTLTPIPLYFQPDPLSDDYGPCECEIQ